MTHPLATIVPLGKRYGIAAIGLVGTVASTVLLLTWDEAPTILTWVATIGPPLSALALTVAVLGPGVPHARMWRAFALGATLIPFIVITIYGAVASLVFALVTPLADAGTDLLNGLRVDPTMLEVLTNPWALVFIIELAVLAPLSEETLKPLAAGIARPTTRAHAFLLGAAAGAGFAAIEDVLYASGWFFGGELWLPVAVLRSTGAALHLLGAGLISVALFERRQGKRSWGGVMRLWGIAIGIHAFWNGSIAVTLILFSERSALGLSGTGLGWGTALEVLLGAFGMFLLGAIVVAARWARSEEPPELSNMLRRAQPAMVAGWASLAALLIVPAVILILVFPDFLAL